MNWRRLLAVWHARNLEFLRDRSTLVFNFLFPLALVVAFKVRVIIRAGAHQTRVNGRNQDPIAGQLGAEGVG